MRAFAQEIPTYFCGASSLASKPEHCALQTDYHRLFPTFTLPASISKTRPTAHAHDPTTTMDTEEPADYLKGLLGRQLRVHTTDTRMFIGIFKCSDAVSESSRKEGQLRAVLTWAHCRNAISSSPTPSNTATLHPPPCKPLPPRRPSSGIIQNPEMPPSRST